MSQFYKLESYDERSFCYAYEDSSVKGIQKSDCDVCGRTVSSWRFEGPHKLLLEGKQIYPDRLLFCGAGGPMLILSEHAVDTLQEKGITGMEAWQPIAATYNDQEAPPYLLIQTCGTIALDYKRMGLKKKKVCNACGSFEWNRQRLSPLFLDESTWDGSDLCRVSDIPGYLICSERFVQTVKETRLTGFSFKPL